MQYVEVKGVKVPALGFGTFDITGAAGTRAVRYALEVGYRHIDTAQTYGNEEDVGRALAESAIGRGELFVVTKVHMDRMGGDAIRRGLEESLRKLRTPYVDLFLLHWPSAEVPMAESLAAIAELKRAGKTRSIGVSNFTVGQMTEAVEVHGAEILCNQVEYHPLLSQRAVLAYVRAHGMMLTAYSPLARGRVDAERTVVAIAEKHGKTAAQVTLRWLIQQQGVSAIPKAASRKHCLENFQIFDFSLTADEVAAISRLGGNSRLIDPSWAPEWDRA